jgi:hypothetical protein
MTPSLSAGIKLAYQKFASPEVRPDVLKWHQEGKPLLDMADALGITFDPALRNLIAGLSDKEVADIRAAMVAALNSDELQMPVDCTLSKIPAAIQVTPSADGTRVTVT